MNINHMLSLALTGLMATTTAFADDAPAIGDILEGLNMFPAAENAPAFKKAADEKFGTQWAVDTAYGYWGAHNKMENELRHAHYLLMHAQLNQRLIQDERNGGTWLRVEFSGSWGLTHKSASNHYDMFNHGGVYGAHSDYFGPHQGLLPEVALMQYFAGKRACVIAGMVNLTNYFDAVSIANDSFANFSHNTFVNSSILPMPDSNAGAVVQVELDTANYIMVGASRTGATFGYNPFTSGPSGYCVVGEYGHIFHDAGITLRINPFFQMLDAEECTDGRKHRNAGLVASIEYAVNDKVTLFTRAGIGARQSLGGSAEFSCGAVAHVTPSRPDDFIGVAYGITKGKHCADDEAYNRRESVMEAMYNVQITDYFKIMPHIQYIHNPAYRPGHGDEVVCGVQAVFSF